MSLQDIAYNEVRIRTGNGTTLQQVPNFVIAGEELRDGQFVTYGADGKYWVCGPGDRATHFVKRSGEKRNSIQEIANDIGKVKAGEPVMAFSGSGVVRIPFGTEVSAGDQLTVGADGYAVQQDPAYAGYIIGQAVEDVTIPEGATVGWGDALITLPAQYP